MPRILACGCGLRRVAPHNMSSIHMSDEYANSPVTFETPSGRRGDVPTPSRLVPTRFRTRVVSTISGSPPAATSDAQHVPGPMRSPPATYATPHARRHLVHRPRAAPGTHHHH